MEPTPDPSRLFDEAARQHAQGDAAAWLTWIAEHGDALVEAMDRWLERASGPQPSDDAQRGTEQMLTLWTLPGLVERGDLSALAARWVATCPTVRAGRFDVLEALPDALERLLHRRPGAPDEAVRTALAQAATRNALSESARQVLAWLAFPHDAAGLRAGVAEREPSVGAAEIQHAWLLRFGEHPEFLATWAAVFESVGPDVRAALLQAAQTPEPQAALLRALAWGVAQQPLEPAEAIAAFAAGLEVPAAGVFLAWYALHGPAEATAQAVEGLGRWSGDVVRAALAVVADEARDPELAGQARAQLEGCASGPAPDDALSRAVQAHLGRGGDPGGLSFADRQLLYAAQLESAAPEGAVHLSDAERERLVARAQVLLTAQAEGRLGAWGRDALALMHQPAWREHPGALASMWHAVTQSRDLPLRRAALSHLRAASEAGGLRLTEAQRAALADLPLDGLQPEHEYHLACLRLPDDPSAWQRLAPAQLGREPPVGLLRHIVAQGADPATQGALGALFEACGEVQRRGLLQALDDPALAEFSPIVLAVARSAGPQTAAAAVDALARVGDHRAVPALHQLADERDELFEAVQAALEGLRGRLGGQGQLAVSHGQAGGLSAPGGGAPPAPPAPAPEVEVEVPPIRLALTPKASVDRLAPPPRTIPLTVLFTYTMLGANIGGLLFHLGAAFFLMGEIGSDATPSSWALSVAAVAVGFWAVHRVSGTRLQLRLLREGLGAIPLATHAHGIEFVGEDGIPQVFPHQSVFLQRGPLASAQLGGAAEDGVLYIQRDGKVEQGLPLSLFRPVWVDRAGRLRARYTHLLLALAVIIPWIACLGMIADRLG